MCQLQRFLRKAFYKVFKESIDRNNSKMAAQVAEECIAGKQDRSKYVIVKTRDADAEVSYKGGIEKIVDSSQQMFLPASACTRMRDHPIDT